MQTLILELDAFYKGQAVRLPWNALGDDHCICTLPKGSELEVIRVDGKIRLMCRPAEGTEMPVIDEVCEDVNACMKLIMDRIIDLAKDSPRAASSMMKSNAIALLMQTIKTYGSPKRQAQALQVMHQWQTYKIGVAEALRQVQEIASGIVEKKLGPTGHRSLARKKPN